MGVDAEIRVDASIGIGDTDVAVASDTPTLLVDKFASCDDILVVIPVEITTTHRVPAGSVAVAAVNISVAVDVPDPADEATNVVWPQTYCVSPKEGSSPNVKSGSTSDTLSAAFSGAVNSKANEIEDSTNVTGHNIDKLLYVSAGVAILVDDEMPTAAMLDDSDVSITWTVREARFAACATELVVTPVAIMTVHIVYGNSVATPVVKVIEGVPVLDPTAEKVVVPQPLVEADRDATKMKLGRTSFMESVPTAKGTLSANVNEIADGAPVTAFSIINELCCRAGTAGAVTAVDEAIGVDIGMLVASARVAPTLRDGVSVACAIALVVTPVLRITIQLVPHSMNCVPVWAVNIRVAVAVPEPVAEAKKAVDPHPY